MTKRKFKSITQAVGPNGEIHLFAIAEDGTAWERPFDKMAWFQLPELPEMKCHMCRGTGYLDVISTPPPPKGFKRTKCPCQAQS